MIRQILFDVAGTLLYKPELYSNIRKILISEGYNYKLSDIKRVHNLFSQTLNFPTKTSEAFYERFNQKWLKALGIKPRSRLLSRIYRNLKTLSWKPYADTQAIRQLRLPMGILSNWDLLLEDRLAAFFPDIPFSPVVSSANSAIRKPEKEIFLLACRLANRRPGEVVYVGNSISLDIEPAGRAGLATVLIDRENLLPYYRDIKIRSLEELEDKITSCNTKNSS